MSDFEPGELWRRICDTAAAASRRGVLLPINSESHVIREAGIEFKVRLAAPLLHKPPARAVAGSPARNPFLPFDPDLCAGELPHDYVCLLNKFPVVEHHVLLVTRQFERQSSPLAEKDFHVLAQCLSSFPGIGFYNSGPRAGASQPHRHLQVVPFPPESPAAGGLPFDTAIESELFDPQHSAELRESANLPFPHCLVALPAEWQTAAQRAFFEYQNVLALSARDPWGSAEYNLLMTRRWMLIVPRFHERFKAISLNGLAFAGCFFVRSNEELAELRRSGPLAALRYVSTPAK